MEFDRLQEIMRSAGIVGAGGAGFPSYAKLNMAADTVILNCSECEPLLRPHRQLLARYAREIMMTLQEIVETLGADRAIIAVKHAYREAVDAVRAHMSEFPKVEISLLEEFYPAGDEVITVYEATGRVIAPGALPISVGCVVYNVETVYNVYRAWKEDAPVTHKYVTVAGEVKTPCTLKLPLGVTFGEVIEMVGGATVRDFAIISGGPMTGRVTSPSDIVTKTTNAILVFPKNSHIIQKKLTPLMISVRRAMAACCQCRMCTDLCTRHAMGHPIEPHKLMNAAASGVATDTNAFLGAFSCSSCGLCEMYSCGQGLNPAGIIAATKGELRKNGVQPPKLPAKAVEPHREYRKVSMSRLISRLGLTKYDLPAPMVDVEIKPQRVKLRLAQGIGAPAVATVTVGQAVAQGEMIASVDPAKLGSPVHSPFDGVVTNVSDLFVTVELKSKKTTKGRA